MPAFRLGVVGAGRMGRTHIRALAGSEAVQVVAVAEPVEAARAALGALGLSVFTDVESLLALGGVDGVLVAAPSDVHLETVRAVLAAGLPVLCEKPCGISSDQAREAMHLASEASLPFQVGYWRRFVPGLRRLRARIEAGEMGEVYLVACYQWDGEPPAPAFRARSGGIFVDMGVHEFDQARWLTGQELVAVWSASAAPGTVGMDPESAQALASMSGGATALVSLGRRFPLGDVCRVELYGTRDWEEHRFLWPPDAEMTFFTALRDQAESFAAHALGGPLQGAGPDDGVAALEAAERCAATVEGRLEH